jgi:hypothetical protein
MTDLETEQLIVLKQKVHPRVTPADVEENILSEYYFTATDALAGKTRGPEWQVLPKELDLLTFCVLVLRNGFTVTGESACASPENFDEEIGRKIARENAKQKIWVLMGYELKTKLSNQ